MFVVLGDGDGFSQPIDDLLQGLGIHAADFPYQLRDFAIDLDQLRVEPIRNGGRAGIGRLAGVIVNYFLLAYALVKIDR